MNYKKIRDAEKELIKLRLRMSFLLERLTKIKVGEEVYTQEGDGYLEGYEYYPVIVKEINHDKGTIIGYENSISETREIETFITRKELKSGFNFYKECYNFIEENIKKLSEEK